MSPPGGAVGKQNEGESPERRISGITVIVLLCHDVTLLVCCWGEHSAGMESGIVFLPCCSPPSLSFRIIHGRGSSIGLGTQNRDSNSCMVVVGGGGGCY